MMLVRHAMAIRPVTVSPDMQLCDARALMAQKAIRRLPVVKDGLKSRREAS